MGIFAKLVKFEIHIHEILEFHKLIIAHKSEHDNRKYSNIQSVNSIIMSQVAKLHSRNGFML